MLLQDYGWSNSLEKVTKEELVGWVTAFTVDLYVITGNHHTHFKNLFYIALTLGEHLCYRGVLPGEVAHTCNHEPSEPLANKCFLYCDSLFVPLALKPGLAGCLGDSVN